MSNVPLLTRQNADLPRLSGPRRSRVALCAIACTSLLCGLVMLFVRAQYDARLAESERAALHSTERFRTLGIRLHRANASEKAAIVDAFANRASHDELLRDLSVALAGFFAA